MGVVYLVSFRSHSLHQNGENNYSMSMGLFSNPSVAMETIQTKHKSIRKGEPDLLWEVLGKGWVSVTNTPTGFYSYTITAMMVDADIERYSEQGY